jgi:F-type H+-transporting ATPase subunit delta
MSAGNGSSLAARSYAQALYNAARTQGVVQRLVEESKMLLAMLNQQPSLRHFLEGPQISREKKRDLLDKGFKNRLNPLLMNLLYMMADRERAVILRDILNEFQEIAERAEGIFPATVASARELGFQEKLKLKTALEKHTGYHLRIKYEVDPDLLGGVVFRFRDLLIDSSVRSGLEQLKRQLKPQEGIGV